ncbi:hypothetical protein GCM10017567_20000 [Amycolatopsis bullii]|uniref:RNA polymerase sigma factor 70 region 4 type 2 domain-containing protein n=1 Tax=Amycolatopsis bullii TaxID=941987 RepID=A0ABQ3K589_9PSEU|nr:hypothetical protein GCM10017567_20000 [Amycolatopsis bullii]
MPYLQPYPDRMLPEDPQESVVARETIELAFIVAVQRLPPRQRAVLILRDVLGWTAPQAAGALELTLASVTSALQRARVTMRAQLPDRRLDWRSPATHELSDAERRVVQSYTIDGVLQQPVSCVGMVNLDVATGEQIVSDIESLIQMAVEQGQNRTSGCRAYRQDRIVGEYNHSRK